MVKLYFNAFVLLIASVAFLLPITLRAQDNADLPKMNDRWKENWKVNIGLTCYRTNMLMHNGDLYIGSNGMEWNEKRDSLDGVYVINPKTGEIKHHIQNKAIADNDVNGLAISKNGTLFFGGDMQYIFAYDTQTFEEIWKYKVGADLESVPALADLNEDGVEDAVFVTQHNGVIALNGATGEVLWKSEIYSHGGNVSPAVYDLNNDGVKDIVAAGGSSFALNGKDGTILWDHYQNSGMHASPMIISSGKDVRIYTSSSYGSFDIFTKEGEIIKNVGITHGLFSSPAPNGQGFAAEGISWQGKGAVVTFIYNPERWEQITIEGSPGNLIDIQSEFVKCDEVSATAISADLNNDGHVEFIVPSEGGKLVIMDPESQTSEILEAPSGAEASLFICDFDNNKSYTIFFAGLDGFLRSYEVGNVNKVVWPGFRGPNNNGTLITN